MRDDSSKNRQAVDRAVRSTVRLCAIILVAIVLRVAIRGLFEGKWAFDWSGAADFIATVAAISFCIQVPYTLYKLSAAAPAEAILASLPSSSASKTEFAGFVAMEYYALILNRTFVVFIAPEALYGWKVRGPVTNMQPTYFQTYAKIITDPALMHNREAVQKLAELKGGFVIPRSQIMGVEIIRGKKWGMGGIPHTGRIQVRLASGSTREFILLGNVDAERVQQEILAGAPVLR